MSKSKRLIELMMTVNRMRKFKVQELADQFGVSTRTILRDLQELSELGVPLYSEVGPHGGYQVLRERVLPPIAFTEEEAVAMFFAVHALRHYESIPFEAESASALGKFYHYMPGDIRDRIDQMKNRVDFVSPRRSRPSAWLPVLLDGAVHQKVLLIEYESKEGVTSRTIQPIGIYANNGLWYCPAYCFLRGGFRVFRCDKVVSAASDSSGQEPMNLRDVHLGNRQQVTHEGQESESLRAELSREAVQRCEAELWMKPMLHIRENGTGWLEGEVPKNDMTFYASLFIGMGTGVTVKEPAGLIDAIKRALTGMLAKYE